MDWHDDKLSAASECYITCEYQVPAKIKISRPLSVDFHFNVHLTISLADMEGKERSQVKRDRKALILPHTRKL